ncbi:hypothetical protein F3J38_00300 [Pantoea sp. Acro-805]|uniref:Uncharacterized protein n=1 Tax=Candidatus Pantoea formicae TaxID=2608355 RepID=A0ABX0QSD7_9GAMM|nr:hypothetical protein [Pantoea formicae]NIE98514.1 hypothetical protein [Pantoea formicae]
MTPWGPIIAAMIAGFIAFIGMIITKENKVSEFRQAWIIEFREEVSYLIEAYKKWVINEKHYSNILVIKQGTLTSEIQIKNFIERSRQVMEIESQSVGEIERYIGRVKLRLNSDPTRRSKYETEVEKLLDKILITKDIDESLKLSNEIYHNTSCILSTEWKVVKKGELSYVQAKKFILALAVFISLIGILSLCFHLEDAMKWLMNSPPSLSID